MINGSGRRAAAGFLKTFSGYYKGLGFYEPDFYRAHFKNEIMIVYKCDGSSFGGKQCSNEVTREMPDWWLMITGKIKNGLRDAHYLEANGTYHFCSRRCFENFFFKNENAASAITGNTDMLQNQLDPVTKQEETQEQATEGTEQSAELENAEEGNTEE